jgi:hypothetical protein
VRIRIIKRIRKDIRNPRRRQRGKVTLQMNLGRLKEERTIHGETTQYYSTSLRKNSFVQIEIYVDRGNP